jgi:putative ABC transport system permease protein
LTADPGFESGQIVMTTIFVPSIKTPESRAIFCDAVSRTIAAIPGVRSSTLGSYMPFSAYLDQIEIASPGKSVFSVASNQVSAGYFSTLGIPILRGRAIELTDTTCGRLIVCPVVVSQQFAKDYLNGSDVIGKTLRSPDGGMLEIVGIAANVAASPFSREYQPVIYQRVSFANSTLQIPLSVRVTGDPKTMTTAIADVLRATYPGAEVDTHSLRSDVEQLAQNFARLEMLIVLLGAIGVFLAVIGIYGVSSFSVRKRTKEMGIRIALGALKKDIYSTVIQSNLWPIWLGLTFGLLLALAGARLTQRALAKHLSMAYYDPFTYVAPACLMLAVSLLAMLVPARRAAACDPSKTLRDE